MQRKNGWFAGCTENNRQHSSHRITPHAQGGSCTAIFAAPWPAHGLVPPSPSAIQAVPVAAPSLLHHAGPGHAVAVRLTGLHPEAAPRLEQPLHRAVQVVPLVCEVQIRQLRSRKSGMADTLSGRNGAG